MLRCSGKRDGVSKAFIQQCAATGLARVHVTRLGDNQRVEEWLGQRVKVLSQQGERLAEGQVGRQRRRGPTGSSTGDSGWTRPPAVTRMRHMQATRLAQRQLQ